MKMLDKANPPKPKVEEPKTEWPDIE
jgi:hypothetical protein